MSVSNYIDGLVQDCNNSGALVMELLQCCTKPSIYSKNDLVIHVLEWGLLGIYKIFSLKYMYSYRCEDTSL